MGVFLKIVIVESVVVDFIYAHTSVNMEYFFVSYDDAYMIDLIFGISTKGKISFDSQVGKIYNFI